MEPRYARFLRGSRGLHWPGGYTISRHSLAGGTMPWSLRSTLFQRYLANGDSSEIDNLDAQDLVAAEARPGLRGMN